MRAAQIYVRQPTSGTIGTLVRAAHAEPRIDLVLWHRRLTTAGADTYVAENQRGTLEFWRGGGAEHGRDAFGTEWSWRGDRAVLRLDMDGQTVASAEYPNAFERIAGVLDAPNSGEVWLTAQPGCEFQAPGGKPHVGGASHGALHALDSLSPVIIGGAAAPKLPRVMRSIDIAPLCMEILGLTMRYRVGDPR
jgi:hypothetical protein